MALPTRYRDTLAQRCEGSLVITVHDDGCLLLYPLPEWEEIERKVMRLPNRARKTRQLQRMLLGRASEVEMDSHGRILIPPRLREFASLGKRVVLAGLGNKFEIWNEENWDQGCENWHAEEEDGSDGLDPLDSLNI